jgi:hypothetical protein
MNPLELRGAAELLARLTDIVGLEGPHHDKSSNAFKLTLGYYILSSVNDFYQQLSLPKHVIDGVDSVADGLENLSRGVVASVMNVQRSQNRPPNPTEIEKLRAHIAALVYVLTSASNLHGQKKAAVARELYKKLQPELGKVVRQADESSRPEKLLTNLAHLYAKNAIGDKIAAFHFEHWRGRMQTAFAKIEPERRLALRNAIIADIKAKLSSLPKVE